MTDSASPDRRDGAGPIHISMAVDRGFEVPLAIALLSLAEAHESSPVRCEVSVLCSGLDASVYARIEQDVAGRVGLTWVEVDPERLDGAHHMEGVTNASLFRILLPELLPAHQTRTIYLDADTLVRRPMTELWHTDLGDHLLAAVRDAGAPYAAGPVGTPWRELGLSPDSAYFNSGVMVLPLDRWREEATAESVLTLLRKTELRWGDQDALNVVGDGRWLELPRCWNLQTFDAEESSLAWALWRSDVERAVAEPAVIHFTGWSKPWRGKPDHPFAHLWMAALDRSSWAGWTWQGPSVAARVKRRVTRAASVLIRGS